MQEHPFNNTTAPLLHLEHLAQISGARMASPAQKSPPEPLLPLGKVTAQEDVTIGVYIIITPFSLQHPIYKSKYTNQIRQTFL